MRNKRVVYLVFMFSILVMHTYILNAWLSSEHKPAASINAEENLSAFMQKMLS